MLNLTTEDWRDIHHVLELTLYHLDCVRADDSERQAWTARATRLLNILGPDGRHADAYFNILHQAVRILGGGETFVQQLGRYCWCTAWEHSGQHSNMCNALDDLMRGPIAMQ